MFRLCPVTRLDTRFGLPSKHGAGASSRPGGAGPRPLHLDRGRSQPPARQGAEGPARAMTPAASRFEAASTIAPSTELAPSAAARMRRARSSSAARRGEDLVHRRDLAGWIDPLAVAAERERALGGGPQARRVVERRVGAVDRLEAERPGRDDDAGERVVGGRRRRSSARARRSTRRSRPARRRAPRAARRAPRSAPPRRGRARSRSAPRARRRPAGARRRPRPPRPTRPSGGRRRPACAAAPPRGRRATTACRRR